MRLDHVSYAADPRELADVVHRIGCAVGAGFVDGGRHPSFGTRNFILPLAGGTYLEVVSALDHPSADAAPFGRAVRRRAEEGGGWLGWVVAVDDIAPVEQRLGRTAVVGSRLRPDGSRLTWRQIGIKDLLDDPQLPFVVQWLVDPDEHPSRDARTGVEIDRLEICGDPATVSDWLGEPVDRPLRGFDVEWVDGDNAGIVAVQLRTPKGVVRLD
ncbi:MAG: VOC family protein [Actinomycetota bacterium]|nr:VOC family protein [Actinomycetota bacterium]